jgi:PHD/YefM family antitoxin component YafN of YafNO toxin-antitoxin module
MPAYPIAKTVGVSDLRTRQKEILGLLSEGPVVLFQHNQPTAVLVDVVLWNQLLEELADLRDARVAAERLAKTVHDPSAVQTLEDVEAELTAEGLIDA